MARKISKYRSPVWQRQEENERNREMIFVLALFLGSLLMGLGAAAIWAANRSEGFSLERRLAVQFKLVQEGGDRFAARK